MATKNWRILVIMQILVVISIAVLCFLPWATIPSSQVSIDGFGTTKTALGKPAILIYTFCGLYLICSILLPGKFKQFRLVFGVFLVAWQTRNWLLLSICDLGNCPIIRGEFYTMYLLSTTLFLLGLPARSR